MRSSSSTRLVAVLATAAGGALFTACRPLAAQQPPPGQPPVQVVFPSPTPQVVTTGRGESRVAPDRATIMVTVETHAATAAAAASENARQTTATLAALRRAGLAEGDLSTMGYTVNPEYQYGPNTKPRVTGYVARNTVRAEVKRIDQVGPTIDAAIAGGANTIGGVQFYASNVDEARRRALAEAVGKACGDAVAMARSVGAAAGQAVELSTQFEPVPRPMMEMAMAQTRAAADVPTPINPGEFTVTAIVHARWPLLYGASPANVAKCQ